MTNKYRNEVVVTLNGTQYALRPTFDAMAQIEDATNTSILHLSATAVTGGLKVKDAFAILKAGIEAAGSKVDVANLKADMLGAGVGGVITAVGTFLTAAVEAGEEAGKD